MRFSTTFAPETIQGVQQLYQQETRTPQTRIRFLDERIISDRMLPHLYSRHEQNQVAEKQIEILTSVTFAAFCQIANVPYNSSTPIAIYIRSAESDA